MGHSTWHIYASVFMCLFMCLVCENQDKDGDGRSFRNNPVIAMNFKVNIDAGKDECFFQKVHKGADVYISFQVIRGDQVGFIIRHPSGEYVHPYKKESYSDYSEKHSPGGLYDICLDNQFSYAHSKLVDIHINVVKYEDWDKYLKELEELHLNVQNFTHVVSILERNIHDMLYFQAHRRGSESRDMTLLLDNESYVDHWSLAEIIVTILACIFQVYFVRRLFDIKTGRTNRI